MDIIYPAAITPSHSIDLNVSKFYLKEHMKMLALNNKCDL